MLRGISYNAAKCNLIISGIYLGLFAVSYFLMIVFIWKMKEDFYEDVMFAAERKAEQLENSKRASNGAPVEASRKEKVPSTEKISITAQGPMYSSAKQSSTGSDLLIKDLLDHDDRFFLCAEISYKITIFTRILMKY